MEGASAYTKRLRSELTQAIGRYDGGRRRKRLLLVSVAALILLAYSAGVATGTLSWRIWPVPDDLPPGVEPRQLGKERVVAQGAVEVMGADGPQTIPWRLTAVESDGGLCIHIEQLGYRGGGCGFDVPPRAISLGVDQIGAVTFAWGPLREDVSSVELSLDGGARTFTLMPIGQDLDLGVTFFVTRIEGEVEATEAIAFDKEGRQLGSSRG